MNESFSGEGSEYTLRYFRKEMYPCKSMADSCQYMAKTTTIL